MTVVYHLCGYDKATERLVEEYCVPEDLLSKIRPLVGPSPNDRDLVLTYELTVSAVQTLAEALGIAIDPAGRHYYFEASDGSDTVVERDAAAASR